MAVHGTIRRTLADRFGQRRLNPLRKAIAPLCPGRSTRVDRQRLEAEDQDEVLRLIQWTPEKTHGFQKLGTDYESFY